jgi:predicted dehydrogenase
VKLTVGHNQQFSNVAREMRELVAGGYLGGPPAHVESYDGYDLGDVHYARAVLNDHNHWVRQLPGALLHNNMSHGVSKVAEFLRGDTLTVKAHGFTSAPLRGAGETEIIDEVRAIIGDGSVTAYYTFSTRMRPVLEQLRLYGADNAMVVDTTQQTLYKLKGQPYKSFLEQFLPPLGYARQSVRAFRSNLRRFRRAELHSDHGKRFLIESFYRSVADGAEVPIPYREILQTARIIDEIFRQLGLLRTEDRAAASSVEEVAVTS